LDGNAKKSKANGSTAYSYVTWSQVKSVFAPLNYIQAQRAMYDTQLDFHEKYLSFTAKCFGAITTGKEAKRLHFIAPIMVCVCFLLKGDVKIVAEEDLVGNFVKAHGHFEFMLIRGTKAVCIVEAKKDDIERGMAQDLVGCEVAAEVGGLDVVYGIVTNYVQWNFFCSRNDKVEIDERSLRLSPNGPERELLTGFDPSWSTLCRLGLFSGTSLRTRRLVPIFYGNLRPAGVQTVWLLHFMLQLTILSYST